MIDTWEVFSSKSDSGTTRNIVKGVGVEELQKTSWISFLISRGHIISKITLVPRSRRACCLRNSLASEHFINCLLIVSRRQSNRERNAISKGVFSTSCDDGPITYRYFSKIELVSGESFLVMK